METMSLQQNRLAEQWPHASLREENASLNSVIASEAKQSRELPTDEASTGLLRRGNASPRNDGKGTKKQDDSSINQFFKTTYPKIGYWFSSIMHTISGINSAFNFLPKKFGEFFNDWTIRISKAITSIRYAHLAVDAFKENKMFDFIARGLDPLCVPWMNLEDIHLARGLSAGLTLVDVTNKKHVNEEGKTKKENFIGHIKATLKNLQNMLDKGLKEEGLPMALFGHLIMLGSFIGIAFGANKRNLMNKIGGVIRNVGGFMGDITMIQHPNSNMKISGIFYAMNAVIDALQRFLPKEIIDTINHFNMILNNIGTLYYGNVSNDMNSNNL